MTLTSFSSQEAAGAVWHPGIQATDTQVIEGLPLAKECLSSVFNSKEVRLLGPSPPPVGEEATALTGAAAKTQVGQKENLRDSSSTLGRLAKV